MERIPSEDLLIGAHTSTAGGIHHALLEGKSIGATTVQLFTANQRQWKRRVLSEEAIALFKETLIQTGLRKIMSHASYLINLGSADPLLLQKSRSAFQEEVESCLSLGLTFLNFHPGSAVGSSKEEALDRIVESLLLLEDLFVDDDLRLLLETTAGQGSSIGSTFEEIAYILERTKDRLPIGVCIDTCHIFVAGYDIRTVDTCAETMDHFDRIVGRKHLHAFHINDSMKDLGSKADRHAPLGEGKIGLETFKFLMTDSPYREIPKYLETPGGPPLWDKEIWMLHEFARKASQKPPVKSER